MRRCHQHGTRSNAEIARTTAIRDPEFRRPAGSLPSSSLRGSPKRSPRFHPLHRAAFYYLLVADDAHIPNWLKDRCSVVGAQHAAPLLGKTARTEAVSLRFRAAQKIIMRKAD